MAINPNKAYQKNEHIDCFVYYKNINSKKV